jgi:propanediol utilization protein
VRWFVWCAERRGGNPHVSDDGDFGTTGIKIVVTNLEIVLRISRVVFTAHRHLHRSSLACVIYNEDGAGELGDPARG